MEFKNWLKQIVIFMCYCLISQCFFCLLENIENLEVPLTNSQANDTYTKVDAKLKCIRNCAIPQDPFLSPYIASDELFSLLPPLAIVVNWLSLTKYLTVFI